MAPITFFIPNLNGGGAQRVVVNLANVLVEIVDRPIHIVLVNPEGALEKDLRQEVSVIPLKGKRTSRAFFGLVHYFWKYRPAVTMGSMNYANVVSAIAHRIGGSPGRLILREATLVPNETRFSKSNQNRTWLLTAMRWSYPLADCIVANSEDTRRSLVEANIAPNTEITVIGNPISRRSFGDKYVEHPSPDLPDSPFICSIGRLSNEKGFDILLLAFSKVRNKNLHLVIMGEGDLRLELETKANELSISHRVHFVGFLQDPEPILKAAKVFVSSSRWEGFGNVIVEALLQGVPVVSTNCPGGPRDILENGRYGRLVPVGDTSSLTLAIEQSILCPVSSPDERKARARDFGPEHIGRKYLDKAFFPITSNTKPNHHL